jgi:hypothetical protein
MGHGADSIEKPFDDETPLSVVRATIDRHAGVRGREAAGVARQ